MKRSESRALDYSNKSVQSTEKDGESPESITAYYNQELR